MTVLEGGFHMTATVAAVVWKMALMDVFCYL